MLYDRNIQTVNSSANKNYIGSQAYIGINYDSLDEKNKKILDKLVGDGIIDPLNLSDNPEERGGREFFIKVPVLEGDTVGIVSDRFMQIVLNFQEQDLLYGKRDFEKRKKLAILFGYADESTMLEELVEMEGGFYDKEEGIWWENQELYIKHKNFQQKNQDKGDSFQLDIKNS